MRASGPEPLEFVFVLEQALGHVVHAQNIERVLIEEQDISALVIPITPGATPKIRPLPFVDNWSLQTGWAARRSLARRLAKHRPDAMFIHTQVAALLSCRMMRQVPTVISLDATPVNFDTMAEAYGHSLQSPVVEGLKKLVNRRALQAARLVVTWTRWAADSVIRDYGVPAHRVHTIPPGVDLTRFRPSIRPRDPGPVRALFVGGDFQRKGGPELLAAIDRLDGAVEVDIVSSSAPPQLSDRPVRVHTGVGANSPKITQLYQRADIFVLPSRGECMSLAIAEALATGLPVISTTVGGVPELVHDQYNGFLIPPGDQRQLAEALKVLVERPDLRRAMGSRSRTLAEAHHDLGKNCRRIFALMAQIAPRRAVSSEVGGLAPARGG